MQLAYREEGKEGKVIIIVHGLFGSSDNWMTTAKKLREHYHIYIVDQRNHGNSPHSDEHNYESMKEDLAEFFEFHKIHRATVIGHSMGGKTAMYFAADYPEKIEKLVVVDIAPVDYLKRGTDSQFHQHAFILKCLKELQNYSFSNRKDIADFLNKRLHDLSLVNFLLKSIRHNKETNSFYCRLNVNVLDSSLDEIMEGVNKDWFDDRLPITSYPVLFIEGEKSSYIGEDEQTQIRAIYPEAEFKIIPNAGHWLHAEQPLLFQQAIEQFV